MLLTQILLSIILGLLFFGILAIFFVGIGIVRLIERIDDLRVGIEILIQGPTTNKPRPPRPDLGLVDLKPTPNYAEIATVTEFSTDKE